MITAEGNLRQDGIDQVAEAGSHGALHVRMSPEAVEDGRNVDGGEQEVKHKKKWREAGIEPASLMNACHVMSCDLLSHIAVKTQRHQ